MPQQKPISHTLAGLLIAGLVIVYTMLMMLVSRGSSQPGGFASYLIIIAGLIFFVIRYGKANDDRLSFGDLFSYGFKATAVYTILFVVFLFLFILFYPDLKIAFLDAARTQMESNKGVTDKQIDDGIRMLDKYFLLLTVGGTMLGFVIVGAIGSLLGAALAKKNPTSPFEQQLP